MIHKGDNSPSVIHTGGPASRDMTNSNQRAKAGPNQKEGKKRN
jgi:hypothetical protein